MLDHYKTLGLNSSATLDEIRRAYRILARRYHPDLNPGANTEERFKTIAQAYGVLSDPIKRENYDMDYDRVQIGDLSKKLKGYRSQGYAGRRGATAFDPKQQSKADGAARQTKDASDAGGGLFSPIKEKLSSLLKGKKSSTKSKGVTQQAARKISIIEVSVSIRDAISGIKKTVELPEPEGTRKVSVAIPAGVRPGSVVRLTQEGSKKHNQEEIVLIVRVANHPFISIQARGIVVEVPVSISEALFGASVSLPTLEDPAVVKIPPGSQSGTEIRLKGKGIKLKDGSTGDLIYRLMVKIPESASAVGIKEKLDELEKYYESPARKNFPQSILDIS